MKQLIIFSLMLLIFSCKQETHRNNTMERELPEISVEQIENFDWLLGKWKRLNEEEGRETFEHWTKESETLYSGFGYTMKTGDTIWQEKMELRKSEEHWDLAVISPEEEKETIFKGTSHTATAFTCENPENEFPTLISYQKDGAQLKANVSDGEMNISFDFEKMK